MSLARNPRFLGHPLVHPGSPRSSTVPTVATVANATGNTTTAFTESSSPSTTTKNMMVFSMSRLQTMFAVRAQVEYYSSVENLCRDIYLRLQMDDEGGLM